MTAGRPVLGSIPVLTVYLEAIVAVVPLFLVNAGRDLSASSENSFPKVDVPFRGLKVESGCVLDCARTRRVEDLCFVFVSL
jgi:hypothetical protein